MARNLGNMFTPRNVLYHFEILRHCKYGKVKSGPALPLGKSPNPWGLEFPPLWLKIISKVLSSFQNLGLSSSILQKTKFGK